jgi:excisionase family DNA binding protein
MDSPTTTIEYFVAPERVAEFLSLTRRRVLELAREGELPAHPVGSGSRRVWRFLLSEIGIWLSKRRA